jgi:hypothetical protein
MTCINLLGSSFSRFNKPAFSVLWYAIEILLNSLSKYKLSVYLKLLYIYKRYAKRVVTPGLHCALPCLAVDILVIFFGYPDDYRTSIIEEPSLAIHKIPHQKTT